MDDTSPSADGYTAMTERLREQDRLRLKAVDKLLDSHTEALVAHAAVEGIRDLLQQVPIGRRLVNMMLKLAVRWRGHGNEVPDQYGKPLAFLVVVEVERDFTERGADAALGLRGDTGRTMGPECLGVKVRARARVADPGQAYGILAALDQYPGATTGEAEYQFRASAEELFHGEKRDG